MQAFILRRYGGPEATALGESPRPAPAAEELLVEVRAAGLNPVDYKFREGQLRAVYRPELPLVTGNELAGVVVECGRRVTDFNVGDRIYARCEKLKMGAFAEFACVHQDVAARMPPGLSYEQAAGVPLAGLTALQTLRDVLDVRSGKRILITGGSGGVGTFAIQVAKHLGAEVTTTASAEGEELVRSIGADHVVNYKQQRFEQVTGGFDGALDLVGGDTLLRVFQSVRRGCRVVSVAGVPEPRTARRDLNRGAGLAALFWLASARIRLAAWRHGVDYRYYFMHASGVDLREYSHLIDDGVVRPVVDRTYSFAQIDEAMAYLEAGHAKGKVVVRMSGADPADPPTSNPSQSQS